MRTLNAQAMNLLGAPASRRPVGTENRNSPARRQRSQELCPRFIALMRVLCWRLKPTMNPQPDQAVHRASAFNGEFPQKKNCTGHWPADNRHQSSSCWGSRVRDKNSNAKHTHKHETGWAAKQATYCLLRTICTPTKSSRRQERELSGVSHLCRFVIS